MNKPILLDRFSDSSIIRTIIEDESSRGNPPHKGTIVAYWRKLKNGRYSDKILDGFEITDIKGNNIYGIPRSNISIRN